MYEAGHGAGSSGVATLEAMLDQTEYEKAVANFDLFISQQLEGAPLRDNGLNKQLRCVAYGDLTLEDVAKVADAADSPRMFDLLKAAEAERARYCRQYEGSLRSFETFDGSTHVSVELYEHMATQNGQTQREKGVSIRCRMMGVGFHGNDQDEFVQYVNLGSAQYAVDEDESSVRYMQRTHTKPSSDPGEYAQAEDIDVVKRLVERSKKNAAPTTLDVVRGGVKRMMNIFSRP
jgi:hypothetical protein